MKMYFSYFSSSVFIVLLGIKLFGGDRVVGPYIVYGERD